MFEEIRFDDPKILAILAWLGLAGTLIGIIVAVIFSKRTPRPRPAYRLHTRNILQAGDKLSNKESRFSIRTRRYLGSQEQS